MLDWDAPLSEQPESVRVALTKLAMEDEQLLSRFRELARADAKGQMAYSLLSETAVRNSKYDGMARGLSEEVARPTLEFGQEAASKALADAGIPGIKYFDGGSRAAGEGTRNIVAFTPEKYEVLSRNGERAVNSLAIDGKTKARLAEVARSERNVKKGVNDLVSQGVVSDSQRSLAKTEVTDIRALQQSRRKTASEGRDPLTWAKKAREAKAPRIRKEKEMLQHADSLGWAKDRREKIASSFAYDWDVDVDARLATLEAITRTARKRGWAVRHTSKGKSGKVDSRYITVPGKGRGTGVKPLFA
jgi:hypothetical protein